MTIFVSIIQALLSALATKDILSTVSRIVEVCSFEIIVWYAYWRAMFFSLTSVKIRGFKT